MDKLKEVAWLFLKLGFIAFGGPAAHIAMMEDEVVTKRQWMSREHFLDLIGATNLIPGPNSTEMAIHCGFHRAGWPGLIVAGICFILPAVFLTTSLAWIYTYFGTLSQIEPFFYGIRPAVLSIILSAVLKLGKKALKGWELGVIGSAAVLAVLLGMNEITAILCGGVIGMLWLNAACMKEMKAPALSFLPSGPAMGPKNFFYLTAVPAAAASAAAVGGIFLVFLKIGSVLFGSGYVLIAYLEGELVQKLQWITQSQLLDAVAVGQFTPGPVLSTAAFIGYQIRGISGAAAATIGIFLPSFLFVAVSNPFIPKMRRSPWMAKFLDAVNMSSVGVMAAVTAELGARTLTDWRTALIAGVSIGTVVFLKKINVIWVVIGGAVAGYVLTLPGIRL